VYSADHSLRNLSYCKRPTRTNLSNVVSAAVIAKPATITERGHAVGKLVSSMAHKQKSYRKSSSAVTPGTNALDLPSNTRLSFRSYH
jgi:antitoxin (DNA-binding transcriptional repressor) of toxin-antitoxin stability system